MQPVSDEYLAGFFDGEGCIVVSSHARSVHGGRQRNIHHTISVSVGSTNAEILEAFRMRFGGRLYDDRKNHARKRFYVWRIDAIDAVRAFLVEMQPFLREKNEQARIGIEFIDNRGGRNGVKLSEELIAVRDGFYWALRNAKHQVLAA